MKKYFHWLLVINQVTFSLAQVTFSHESWSNHVTFKTGWGIPKRSQSLFLITRSSSILASLRKRLQKNRQLVLNYSRFKVNAYTGNSSFFFYCARYQIKHKSNICKSHLVKHVSDKLHRGCMEKNKTKQTTITTKTNHLLPRRFAEYYWNFIQNFFWHDVIVGQDCRVQLVSGCFTHLKNVQLQWAIKCLWTRPWTRPFIYIYFLVLIERFFTSLKALNTLVNMKSPKTSSFNMKTHEMFSIQAWWWWPLF